MSSISKTSTEEVLKRAKDPEIARLRRAMRPFSTESGIDLITDMVATVLTTDKRPVTPEDIRGLRRDKEIQLGRHLSLYLGYVMLEVTFNQLGLLFRKNCRPMNHTSVMHDVKLIHDTLSNPSGSDFFLTVVDTYSKTITSLKNHFFGI